MKKIMIYIQALLASFVLVSCLHDDNELFNESAAQRLDKAVEHYKQVLESANNGWELQPELIHNMSLSLLAKYLPFCTDSLCSRNVAAN